MRVFMLEQAAPDVYNVRRFPPEKSPRQGAWETEFRQRKGIGEGKFKRFARRAFGGTKANAWTVRYMLQVREPTIPPRGKYSLQMPEMWRTGVGEPKRLCLASYRVNQLGQSIHRLRRYRGCDFRCNCTIADEIDGSV